jgi:O-methyltransferase
MNPVKTFIRGALQAAGYEIRRVDPGVAKDQLKDAEAYRPLFQPWRADPDFSVRFEAIRHRTLVSPDRCHILQSLLRQSLLVPGDIWECGVYRGGTAALMAGLLRDWGSDKTLHLFDTYEGMPATDSSKDWHRQGDFQDTSLESVRSFVNDEARCRFHAGFIPQTFAGLEASTISFAHVDLDIYRSITDAATFIWPRLSVGGAMVFDDYGFPTCAGARMAVDDFFAHIGHVPLVLPTGQAIVIKAKA